MNSKTQRLPLGAVIALIIAALGLSLATAARADRFPECVPFEHSKGFAPADDRMEWAKKWCNAREAVFKEYTLQLDKLDQGRETLAKHKDDGDWTAFKKELANLLPVMKEMNMAAVSNQEFNQAFNLIDLYTNAVGLFTHQIGLPKVDNLNDFYDVIAEALDSGDNQDARHAASVAMKIANQSVTRGTAFVEGLADQAGHQINREFQTARSEKAALAYEMRRAKAMDSTSSDTSFMDRLVIAWKPWFLMLIVVSFGGAWLGSKRGANTVVMGLAAGLSYLVPGIFLMLVYVFLPFVPWWVLIAATLAGTALTYHFAGRIFEGLARWVGFDSPTGRRLRFIGYTIDNLRGTTSSSAAVQAATHGSARWGKAAEIAASGHLAPPGEQAGLALARVSDAPAGLDERFRYVGHVVTVAPNGSGKGIGQVIPNLLEYPGSCIVLDVKGENAAVTARARREMGHAVHVVDPFGVNGEGGAAFNVLDRLDVTNPDCVSESAVLADCLVVSEAKGGDGLHFDESAKILLQGLMLYVAGLDDPERRTLGELRRLLTGSEDALFELLALMADDDQAAFGIPARAANTLMGMADKERGAVLSTSRRNTAFLDDPRIAAAMSRSDFDLSAIKSELMSIYLVMPANRIGPNARFLRLFIGSVIAAITASAKQPPHRVAFVLDEFAQLGHMKSIEDAVSLMRGYGLAFWVFLQDLSQLKGVYPKWQTFMANSAKVFFGCDDYDTAKYVSDSLGKSTIEFETENTGRSQGRGFTANSGSLNTNSGRNTGSSQQFTGRELLTPDEVMRQGPDKPIVLVKGEYPYLLDRLNYLSDPEYQGLFDANPYHG